MTTRRLSDMLWLGCLGLTGLLGVGNTARSDEPASILQAVVQAKGEPAADASGQIVQTSCTSCGSGLFGNSTGWSGSCSSCGGNGCGTCGSCFPGQLCEPCEGEGFVGRALARLHNCICCPDPCYEPRWVAAANAAF